jgi:hypothetical protein
MCACGCESRIRMVEMEFVRNEETPESGREEVQPPCCFQGRV